LAQKFLWGSLVLGPIVIALNLIGIGETALFVLAAAALVPLAWLIGVATEEAAHHVGPGIGGFLNATFGNAPELIIALFAVGAGLTEVVRGSLSGSVVGNLLLVLGFSLLFGGRGDLDRQSTFVSLALVGLATLLFLVPAIPGWSGDPERESLELVSLPVSIALLLVYLAVMWFALRRHHELHISEPAPDEELGQPWPLWVAVVVLAAATVVTSFVAEIVVDTIHEFAEATHLSDFFVAAVIVAIVGNAAEHGGAVVVAYRGRIKLAAEIALASSAQVAVFLVPAVALLAWLINPLALSFRQVEVAVLGAAALLAFALLFQGRSSRGRGVALIAAYVAAAAAFFIAGDR
jgi:Ca2+:H+ antiporter